MRKRIVITLLAVAAVAATTLAVTDPADAQGRGTRLYSRLTQTAAIGGVAPVGRVTYREGTLGPRNLVIRVGQVNLPPGTRLQVNACDGTVGWMTLRTGKRGVYASGQLRLRVRDGDPVPKCAAGDPVRVTGASVELAGTLTTRR